MPALKPGTVIPTDGEDAVITAAALSDPDALPLTEVEWASVKSILRLGGRPKAEVTKERITIRLSPDVMTAFKATGKGWQSRIDAVLKEWVQEHQFQKNLFYSDPNFFGMSGKQLILMLLKRLSSRRNNKSGRSGDIFSLPDILLFDNEAAVGKTEIRRFI